MLNRGMNIRFNSYHFVFIINRVLVQKPIVEVSVVAVRHDHSDMLQFK